MKSMCDLVCEQDLECLSSPAVQVVCCVAISGARLCLPIAACR